MDADRFDTLSRALTTPGSRRTTLRALLGALLAGALLGSPPEAHADHGCLHAGGRCKKHGQCCSGKCSRKRKKCVCTAASCTTTDPCKEAVCSSKFTCSSTEDPDMEGQPCSASGDPGTCQSGECISDPVCGNGLCEAGECDLCPGDCTADECPPTVANVSVSPDPVLIGSSSQGTVTLNRTAQGDTTVNLSVSDTSAASVPSTVTVANGATSESFSVTGIAPSTQVVLSATLGSATVQTAFAVENASP